ncbi:MAG: hypothetical protein KAI47_05900, partial [Deltaproteobacteria bacterium]|nr:hypothetical protein [Deltaproteobacteria bacterium]
LGRAFSCVLTSNGRVYCWGDDMAGELGDAKSEGEAFSLHPDVAMPQEVGGVDILHDATGGTDARVLAAGGAHACGISSDGKGVICWGLNDRGQVKPTDVAPAKKVFGPNLLKVVLSSSASRVTSLALGDHHSCALTSDGGENSGLITCWGDNSLGQLGNAGSSIGTKGLEKVSGLSAVTHLACGKNHCCAVGTGKVAAALTPGIYCWGEGEHGQLGVPPPLPEFKTVPVLAAQVNLQLKPWSITALACGGDACCVAGPATAPGTIVCWGADAWGQRIKTTDASGSVSFWKEFSVDGGSVIRQLRVGREHFCARTVTGDMSCWGGNAFGQVGSRGTQAAITIGKPRQMRGENLNLEKSVSDLALGDNHSCAIAHGQVACWGGNRAGQVGNGKMAREFEPKTVAGLGAGQIYDIASGAYHTCAVGDDGSGETLLACWGFNAFFQSASSTAFLLSKPERYSGAKQLSTSDGKLGLGAAHSCYVATDESVYCWGANQLGQAGQDPKTEGVVPKPQEVDPSHLSNVNQVVSGFAHTCALKEDGKVYCWGSMARAPATGTSLTKADPSPKEIKALDEGNVALSAFGNATCVLTKEGAVRCWGDNSYGKLGFPKNSEGEKGFFGPENKNSFTNENFIAIALGGDHACAVTSQQKVYCWGQGASGGGRVGGTRAEPVAVTLKTPADASYAINSIDAIAAGWSFTCAVVSDKTLHKHLYCWGGNFSGELALDPTVPALGSPAGSPPARWSVEAHEVLLSSANNLSEIGLAPGWQHVCARVRYDTSTSKPDEVYCWGSTSLGQLGHGVVGSVDVPAGVTAP